MATEALRFGPELPGGLQDHKFDHAGDRG